MSHQSYLVLHGMVTGVAIATLAITIAPDSTGRLLKWLFILSALVVFVGLTSPVPLVSFK